MPSGSLSVSPINTWHMLALQCFQEYYDSHLVGFWQLIFELYCKLMTIYIQPPPEVVLLSMIPESFRSVKKDILQHFLTSARTVIPRHWKSSTVPSLGEWAIALNSIRDLERILAREVGKEVQFSLTWTTWSMFRYISDFQTWAESDTDPSPMHPWQSVFLPWFCFLLISFSCPVLYPCDFLLNPQWDHTPPTYWSIIAVIPCVIPAAHKSSNFFANIITHEVYKHLYTCI